MRQTTWFWNPTRIAFEAPPDVYQTLALGCVRGCLEDLCARDDLQPDFALPPRLCSRTLVQELPPLALAEADAAW